jgi:hypothetical protein
MVCVAWQFHEDARKLTRRLNRMKAGLLDPTGKFMEKWDLVIIFVMLYTSFITPWELAFVRTPSTDALFICNQFVNGIFWVRRRHRRHAALALRAPLLPARSTSKTCPTVAARHAAPRTRST